MKKIVFTSLLLIGLSGAANAQDCWYNGYEYPPGTTVGGFVCMADGSWK